MERFDFIEPLPDWAEKESDGYYMIKGTQLCTRDGRRCGNAHVSRIDSYWHAHCGFHIVAIIITDYGNEIKLNLDELRGLFHKPKYIMKL